ncbi:MAG: VOC family protein [Candidatus Hodarchaeota archaeon]
MRNVINFDFNALKISQLGYVYKNIRKQASVMEQFFGIPKFTVLGPLEMKIVLRGKETKWTVTGAFSQLFNGTDIELVQPGSGESIHQEFLDQGREGIHHICYNVDDLEAVIEKFKQEGIGVLQTGKIIGLKYAYMDTESLLGIIIEFSTIKKGRKRR